MTFFLESPASAYLRSESGVRSGGLREHSQLKEALDAHAVVAITDRAGYITYVNDRFCKLSKYSRHELIGQTHRVINSGVHPPQLFQELWRTIASGKIWQGEICNKAKDGTLYWVQTTIVPFLDDQGRPYQYVSIRTDISLLKLQEEQIRLAKRLAEEAAQAKSALLANTSHEIRSPVNAMLGMAQLILGTDLAPPQRQYLEQLLRSGDHLRGVIDDILDLSKFEAGRMELEAERFELATLLETAQGLVAERCRAKGLALHTRTEPDVPPVLVGDPLRLRQVLVNYLSNAVKFTDKGHITVSVGVKQRGPDGVLLAFQVQDTGIGLTREQLQRLFTSFSQAEASTSRRYGGTGLGLAICRQLAQLMHGAVWAESTYGVGSTFGFSARLGLAAQAPVQADPGARVQAPDLRGCRVLVVEDNEVNQFVARDLLQQAGLEVDVAGDGASALERVGRKAYDLVLMDLQMPEMDGIEATRALRRRLPPDTLPVIALTGQAMAEDRQACRDAGMNDFLAKPINVTQLWPMLARWCSRKSATPAQADAPSA